MKNQNVKTLRITQAAIIAAVYTVLSLIFAPISYGLVQIRVAEMLTILPAFSAAAVPGLFVGCLLANLIGTMLGLSTVIDVVLGSIATLIAAIFEL
jgi:uncharacterized membrane protein